MQGRCVRLTVVMQFKTLSCNCLSQQLVLCCKAPQHGQASCTARHYISLELCAFWRCIDGCASSFFACLGESNFKFVIGSGHLYYLVMVGVSTYSTYGLCKILTLW